jgi:hypothetical protein
MGIISLLLIVILGLDSVTASATMTEEIIGNGSSETEVSYMTDEEIWAQIDKSQLRALVDTEALRATIDKEALLSKIDINELEQKINITRLMAELSQDELLREFNELKASGMIDAILSGEDFLEETETPSEDIEIQEDEAENEAENEDVSFIDAVSRTSDKPAVVKTSQVYDPLMDEELEIDENGIFRKTLPVNPVTNSGKTAVSQHLADVVNVQYPIIGEKSPFDFIVDPMGLIYSTSAVKYGGGEVEEKAGILFKNTEGKYTLSSRSDLLSIVNRGNIPVRVEIRARLNQVGDVKIVEDTSEMDGTTPSIFFALTDENGISSVFTESGETVISLMLDPVSEDAYEFAMNEETGEYEMLMNDGLDDSVYDSCKFGLTADCDRNADWSDVKALPEVSVTWVTEPIFTDWDLVKSELEENDKILFEAYKKYKIKQLRDKELQRLIEIELEELINEELGSLIDTEVARLAMERFMEIKESGVGVIVDESQPDEIEDAQTLEEDISLEEETETGNTIEGTTDTETEEEMIQEETGEDTGEDTGETDESTDEEYSTGDDEQEGVPDVAAEEPEDAGDDVVIVEYPGY